MGTRSFNTPAILGLLSTSTFSMVQFLVIALYPAIAEAMGISVAQVILCFTLGSFFFIWTGPFWSKLSDRFGRQKILSVGLFGLTLSFAVLVYLIEHSNAAEHSFYKLLLSRIFYGLTASGIVSVVQAWWRDQQGDVSKNMITHSMGLNFGRLLAPILALSTFGNIHTLLWCLFAWTFILTVSAFYNSSHSAISPKQETAQTSSVTISYPIIMALISTVFIGIIHSTLAHQIQTSLNLSSQETTLLCSKVLLMSSVIALILQFALRKIKNLNSCLLLSLGIPSWIVAAFFFYELHNQIELWTAIFFISTGIASITPGYLSLLQSGGKAAGYIGSTQTIGLTIGGVMGYGILEGFITLGPTLFVLCILLSLTSARLGFYGRKVPC